MGTAMNCEHYTEHIGDLIDGTISQARRDELDRHLAACASCRAVVADLREIRSVSSQLPVHKPPERVWQRLTERLPDLVQESVREGRTSTPGRWFRSMLTVPRLAWGGAMAAALAAVLFFVALPRLRPTPVRQMATTASAPIGKAPASAVHAGDGELVQSVESELQAAERHYQNAIGGLEQMAKSGEPSLDPQLASTIRSNLAVVDRAINESRTALASQPTNELAQESLFEAFRRKVGLLQDTVALMNEMRKGNQAEAAKILGNMNK
ncbi:MAG: anti-sigma factor family protein [Bacteroidales bacterium]